MGQWIAIACTATLLTGGTMAAVRLSVQGIWDAIAALLVFIAIFVALGDQLALSSETALAATDLLPAATTGTGRLLISSLLAIDATMVGACGLVLALRKAVGWSSRGPSGA